MCAPTLGNRSFLAMKAIWMDGPWRGEGAPPHEGPARSRKSLRFALSVALRAPAPPEGEPKVKGRADGDIGPYAGFMKVGDFLRTNDARLRQAACLSANK